MDLESNANNRPCCSKTWYKEPFSSAANKYSKEIIEIDDDDSCDSAYETGSAVSRSSLSSPTGEFYYIPSYFLFTSHATLCKLFQILISILVFHACIRFAFGSHSSTADLRELKINMKNGRNDRKHRRKKIHYYANIHYEQNIVAPWPFCLYKKECLDDKNTIVISDSDDEDAHNCESSIFTMDTLISVFEFCLARISMFFLHCENSFDNIF